MNLFFKQNNNYRKELKINNKSGFTLIEALTVLFIFSLITLTFYSVFTLGTNYIIESKNRLGAVSLANERMEIIRNMQYDAIGVQGAIPAGDIPAVENVFHSSKDYEVATFVQYIDDPFDGVSPADTVPNDYKRAKITVSWDGVKGARSNFSLVARFVPPGIEQAVSGGVLSINIMNRSGIGVPQASVHIVNANTDPVVNMTAQTDNTGNVTIPTAPPSTLGYYITVSKDGYETVESIDPDSITYTATDIPASVVDGAMNVKSITQDRLIDLKFITNDQSGNVLANVDFKLIGGRILGYDELSVPVDTIYNINTNYSTDSNGEKNLEDINPGQFFISEIAVPSGYTLVGMDNFYNFDPLNNQYSIIVVPGDSQTVKIKFANNLENSLLVRVADSADGERIGGARVTLSNVGGYGEEVITMDDGVAYFPFATDPLEVGTYDLRVETDGYGPYEGEVNIDGLVEQQIDLAAN